MVCCLTHRLALASRSVMELVEPCANSTGFLLSNLACYGLPKDCRKGAGRSPTFLEPGEETDSPVEEDGFELAVPPRRERLWAATPGKHRRLGPEPVSGSAFRAAVSDWQRPEEPFAGAGPMVRIRFP